MTRLTLQVRLTVLVTAVFAIALLLASITGLSHMKSSLRTETRNNAAALLQDYFDQLQTGILGPADAGDAATTRFFYLDESGQEISQFDFQLALFDVVESQFQAGVIDLPAPIDGPFGPALDTTIFIEASSVDIVLQPLEPATEPRLLDRGDDVIAVGTSFALGPDVLTVAVSSPVRPISDSLDALRRLLLILVPAITGAIAAATWLIVGRALRPVETITAQVDRITTESLDQRVAIPAAGDEIGHLATTMNSMLSRLQQARDNQNQFVSDASHELRSPITAAHAVLEVALRQPDEQDWPATAATVLEETTRLGALVEDLLLLAQLDENSARPASHMVDLDELCLAEAARPHPCPVHVRVNNPARIRGHQGHLTRAIRNLVDNAARYATHEVRVVVSATATTATVDVIDDGPGIPGESLERIFDRFTRLDEARSRQVGTGTGLGLAITKRIVLAHHGTIAASNNEAGATFRIELPTAPNDVAYPLLNT